MKNSLVGEIIISALLVAVLIFFLDPLKLMMPQSMHVVMIPLLIILFIVFTAVIWKETGGDERENLHKFIASRFAYFAATAILLVGVIIENFQKTIDPWLVIALCVVLLAKITGRIYGYITH